MTLLRYDPFKEFTHLQDEMSRWLGARPALRHSDGESVGWTPAADIYEDAEGLTLKFDLPDVDPKNVDIRLEDGVLTLRGERKLEHEDKRDSYHRIECAYGAFTRTFSLPATFDFEKVRAEHKNGVLRVFLPKRAEAKPKSVQIKIN
jgi:HSP20 family protein